MRISPSAALLVFLCAGCHAHKAPVVQQAQAPPLQTEGGTLTPPKSTQPLEKSASPLASPLPPPSAAAVPLPPPPPPKKVRRKVKAAKPVETPPAVAASTPTPSPAAHEVSPTASPIGQLTTGDAALGERTKHETEELIASTQQGLNGIKRPLSQDEKVTAAQIVTFLRVAQQALSLEDTDGAHTLATKARLLLDELTKP